MEDKILDRVRKLFALGSNNPNEHEAESAMKMAKKLLDKHNISIYDLQEKEQVGVKIEDNVNMPWVRLIYGCISDLYDIKYITDKSSNPTTHLLVGTESNRVTASIVIDYVISYIRDESKGLGNGYRNAAAMALYDKVMAILDERNSNMEEVIPGTGLLPIDISRQAILDADDWANKMIGGIKKSKSVSVDYNASGRKLGNSININPHLSNKRALN